MCEKHKEKREEEDVIQSEFIHSSRSIGISIPLLFLYLHALLTAYYGLECVGERASLFDLPPPSSLSPSSLFFVKSTRSELLISLSSYREMANSRVNLEERKESGRELR